MQKLADQTGTRYGRLLVTGEAPFTFQPSGRRVRQVFCLCDCGTVKAYGLGKIRHGTTQSCGCLKTDLATKHGFSKRYGTPEWKVYSAWNDMKNRCYNQGLPNYKNYGGRGITVHPAWQEFQPFFDYVGLPPSKDHSLERIKNDGHYEPGNVRWATREEQQNNRRNNVLLSFDGMTMTMTQWARHLGWPVQTITARLRLGWSVEKTLSTPRTIDRTNKHRVCPSVLLQSTG